MTDTPIIVWFRRDLRLADHAALSAAVATGRPVLPVFVLDDAAAGAWRMGAASRWWLHHSLEALDRSLKPRGVHLVLRRGSTPEVLHEVAKETGAAEVYCSRSTEPWAMRLEGAVRDRLAVSGIAFQRIAGGLVHEPDGLKTQGGTPFKV